MSAALRREISTHTTFRSPDSPSSASANSTTGAPSLQGDEIGISSRIQLRGLTGRVNHTALASTHPQARRGSARRRSRPGINERALDFAGARAAPAPSAGAAFHSAPCLPASILSLLVLCPDPGFRRPVRSGLLAGQSECVRVEGVNAKVGGLPGVGSIHAAGSGEGPQPIAVRTETLPSTNSWRLTARPPAALGPLSGVLTSAWNAGRSLNSRMCHPCWPTCPQQRYDRAGQRSRRVMDAEHLGVTALTARPLSSPGGLVIRVIGRELGL